ncbi:MAG: sulfatase-like hydrolase/transferase [Bryobacterales bacterium]|nr:sulfatase-like hydrolase/transferase [Bryobacterales bacterium]
MSELTRRSVLGAAAAAALSQAAPGSRPNILFVCSDQHSGAVMGHAGHPQVKTPHMDRLAARGVTFQSCYSGNPVCVPGRASLMTGQFASDVESYCNSTPFRGQTPTWGNRLKSAGYHPWATGKLDLWKDKDLGFEEDGTTHGHCTDPDITSLFRSPVCFRPKERNNANGTFSDRQAPDLAKVQKAMKFLRERSRALGKPWAAYVGVSKPHPKFDAALKYKDIYPAEKMLLPEIPPGYLENRHPMFQVLANYKNIATPVPADRVRKARSAYYGLVSEVDELLGQLLDELDRTGQMENTLVIYTSDHGEMLGEHGLWLKNVLLEGAARVPLIMAGAGLPRGKTIATPVSHVDLVATMMEAGGVAKAKELRGNSLLPVCRGERGAHPEFAFSESHSEGNATGSFLIRKGDWKYIYFSGDRPLLFHLKNDPGEFHNLAGQPQTKAIQQELDGILRSLVDPDAVSEAAFRRQDEVLRQLVASSTKEDFYENLVGRLGPMQARSITNQCYRRKV